MDKRTCVYITTYNNDRNSWLNHQERLLREFYDLSDKKYGLVDDLDDADIILIVDVWENIWQNGYDCWIDNVGNHPLIKKYPNKSYSVSDIDSPPVLHHGIYASGEKRLFSAGRVRTGSYTLFFPQLLNPFVEQYVFDAHSELEKEYLFSFVGRRSHPIRDKIFNLSFERKDILLEDSSKFEFFNNDTDQRLPRQKYYFETLQRSKFSLCPRGSGASSLRLFESMQLGVVPVIISNAWIPPRQIRWSDFCIIIREKNFKELEKIITSFESSYRDMGLVARKAYDENFSKEVYFNFIVDNCIHIRETQWIPESFYQKNNLVLVRLIKIKNRMRIRSRINELAQILKTDHR